MPRRWLQGSAQGFNPGNPQNNEFALKGREADLTKLAPIAALNLECAIETCYNWTYFRVVSTFDLPPPSGRIALGGCPQRCNPGLGPPAPLGHGPSGPTTLSRGIA